MPKREKKPAQTAAPPAPTSDGKAPTPPGSQPANPHGLPVVYDHIEITERSTTSEAGPLTVEWAERAMVWETEKQYQKRMVKEKGGEPAHYLYGDTYHCIDTFGEKVRCWANANNRWFDMEWCEALIQTVLRGQWAGPLTVPGGTVNGETVRISQYGRVLSGQHQLTALILANERLQASRAIPGNVLHPKYPFWNGHAECVIETITVKGLSEDERVLRSIDFVKPRSVSDMLSTMEVFRQNTSTDRKELTRMLASAIDLLWVRTDTKGYRTHPEVVGFLERHKRLLKCVEHLFAENSAKGLGGGRRISVLPFSAGHAAALCYLMGSAGPKTDGDVYRNEDPAPSENGLDWAYWDRAREFWSRLASDHAWMPVRKALGRLMDSTPGSEENLGLGGRQPEKLAILAKAWEVWKDHSVNAGAPFTDDDLESDGCLTLEYTDLDAEGRQLPDGKINLIDCADFYGIDCPRSLGRGGPDKKGVPMPPPPTQEEIWGDRGRPGMTDQLRAEAATRRQEK